MRNPFTTSPVWGERFFGREKIVEEVLYGSRDGIWVVGIRRIGKTSLLKQLEHRTRKSDTGYIGVYFDLEGCHGRAALKERLLTKLEMSAETLEAKGVPTTGLHDLDFFPLLQELLRRVHRVQKKLLLLCDEAEALIEIARAGELDTLARWRGIAQEGDYVRTVLASTQNLKELKNFACVTSPFLNGFEPPLYLSGLAAEESARLIRQMDGLAEAAVDRLIEAAGNHPFLTQLLAMRLWEARAVEPAIAEIEHNRMLCDSFLKEDFQSLTSDEQRILTSVSQHQPIDEARLSLAPPCSRPVLQDGLANLRHLGLIRETPQGFVCANRFFRAWLERGEGPGTAGPAARRAFDDLVVDFKKREVYKNGHAVRMTRKEFDVLKMLMERSGEVVDRFDLLGWSPEKDDGHADREFTTRTVDMLVARIRRKLQDDPAQPKYIESVRGIGYKFIAAIHRL